MISASPAPCWRGQLAMYLPRGGREVYSRLLNFASTLGPFQPSRRSASERDGLSGCLLAHRSTLSFTVVGIVRAGAAYVPIDINHPAERRARILSDAARNTPTT